MDKDFNHSIVTTRFVASDDHSNIVADVQNILLDYKVGDKIVINHKNYEIVDDSYDDEISTWVEDGLRNHGHAQESRRITVVKSAIFRKYVVYEIS